MTRQWYEELYENFNTYSDEPYVQNTREEVDFIEQEIDYDQSKRILDVGCGNGRHVLELTRRGYHVVGIDLSESMLAQGRRTAKNENLNMKLIQCDARKLQFQNEFDVAIMLCEGAFSLMEEDEMDQAILVNISGALHSNGKLIMTAPNAVFKLTQQSDDSFSRVTFREVFTLDKTKSDGSKVRLNCTQRYYTCPELNWMLKEAGFQRVEFFACTKAGYDRNLEPDIVHFEFGAIAIK